MIQESDKPKTTFITMYMLYEYVVMSFGLTNPLAYFMYLMNKLSMEYVDKFVVVFINGILIYSKDEDTHVRSPSDFAETQRAPTLCQAE
jgi:hypothetical protein